MTFHPFLSSEDSNESRDVADGAVADRELQNWVDDGKKECRLV